MKMKTRGFEPPQAGESPDENLKDHRKIITLSLDKNKGIR